MKYLLILFLAAILSCSQKTKKGPSDKAANVTGIMIQAESPDSTRLMILLMQDGTINRSGDLKNKDNDVFLGMTKENYFEQLKAAITDDLLEYRGEVHGQPDPTKNMVKMAFGGLGFEMSIEYYSDDPLDKFPQPIRDYINKAIEITDPWFREQKKLTEKNDQGKKGADRDSI